jgi:ABC-type multidrug transport system permease subunit
VKADLLGQRRFSRAVSAVTALARLQALLITRYPVNFAASLLGSFGGVLAMAFGLKLFSPPGSALHAGAILFYGYLLFIFLSDSLWRIGHSLWEEQRQGTLLNLYLTPAPRFALLAARGAPLLAITLLGALLACLVATLLFGRLPAEYLGLSALILFFSIAGMAGVGFIFACYHLLVGESASTTGNVIEFGALFVCAMFFPFQALPGPVLLISRLIPLSYCVDAFRSALLGFPQGYPELAPFGVEMAVVAAFGVLTPLLSYAVFRWTMDRMRKTGRLG